MDRQVEKENGRSRSSKGRAACSGRTPEVRTDGSKRERGRSVSATSVGGTTSEQAAPRGEAESPEEVSADAKEIPIQVPGAQVPEEGRRQRRKRN